MALLLAILREDITAPTSRKEGRVSQVSRYISEWYCNARSCHNHGQIVGPRFQFGLVQLGVTKVRRRGCAAASGADQGLPMKWVDVCNRNWRQCHNVLISEFSLTYLKSLCCFSRLPRRFAGTCVSACCRVTTFLDFENEWIKTTGHSVNNCFGLSWQTRNRRLQLVCIYLCITLLILQINIQLKQSAREQWLLSCRTNSSRAAASNRLPALLNKTRWYIFNLSQWCLILSYFVSKCSCETLVLP